MFESHNMDTSYHGGGGFMATQDTADRRNTGRSRGSPWIPVFTSDVRDLLPGQDAVRRGAHESSEVTFVGVIRTVERKFNSPSIDYMVDDNTGPPLLCNQLIEVDSGQVPIAENTYVRVVGKVRTWGNTRGVIIFSIAPIKDMNELTMHILEVNYIKLFYSKDMLHRHEVRALNKVQAGGGGAGMTASHMTSSSAYTGMAKSGATAAPISAGLTGINGEIHKFLSTATSESGYSVNEIVKRFPHIPQGKVREQLDLLASEGHVYTTIDDEHYRTTDN